MSIRIQLVKQGKSKFVHVGQDAYGLYVLESKNLISLERAIKEKEKEFYGQLFNKAILPPKNPFTEIPQNDPFAEIPQNVRGVITSYLNARYTIKCDTGKSELYRETFANLLREKVHDFLQKTCDKLYNFVTEKMRQIDNRPFDKTLIKKYEDLTASMKFAKLYEDLSYSFTL